MFAADSRPTAAALRALADSTNAFSVSLDPAGEVEGEGANWLELLVSGLTFDVSGLMPGPAAGPPPRKHVYGLPRVSELRGLEAVIIRPGPHLAGGSTMPPVLRMLAWLTAQLCALPDLRAVVWHPASCWSAPAVFQAGVTHWIEGGPFPTFSLAGLAVTPDEALQSEGVGLFTGQELRIEPELAMDRPEAAKIAVRLIHWLVESGPLKEAQNVEGPGGACWRVEPSADGRLVRVRTN
ncbi:MAG: hypothetical protein ABIT09_03855 [Croceibacterium sp.]